MSILSVKTSISSPNGINILYIGAMLSSLDITRILAESGQDITGAEIIGFEWYRKERAVQLYYKADRRNAITMSYHPQRSGFFILPAGRSRLDTKEKHRPFAREINGGDITSITQVPHDRFVEITVDNNSKRQYLVFEVIGPNGDVLILDNDRIVRASIRNKKGIEGKPYAPSSIPEKLNPDTLTESDIHTLFSASPETDPIRLLEKNVYGLDYYLARTIIARDSNESAIARAIRDLAACYRGDGPIYAYTIKGKTVFYPVKITGFEPAEKFKTLSQAQQEIVIGSKAEAEEASFRDITIKSLNAKIAKTSRLLNKLEKDIEEAANYERYLQYADLLKIHLAELRRGMKQITVPDLYNEDVEIRIPLEEKLTGPENVEVYSRRYRKGKEGLELLTRRLENTKQEKAFLEEALDAFDTNFEQSQNQYPELLPTITDGRPTDTTTRKPYKEYQTSTGLLILVGKTGADNDRTTFEYARPHELWFHASQCPGSHVVMKYPHKSFEPSAVEIAETAAAAAWASKARGSAKVPVSYTQKKYVRKPRKAKAGLVTIEREKTILVEPKELKKRTD